MSHQDDWLEMRSCVRLAREIFAQPAFDAYRGEELAPGPDCVTDDELDQFIRDKVESAYHPCGTCRMGGDRRAVVDPECRVHGIESLRVVDSSIMPQATAGDLNAPTLMLAERAADIILGKKPLVADEAACPIDPEWRTRQRSSNIDFDAAGADENPRDYFDLSEAPSAADEI